MSTVAEIESDIDQLPTEQMLAVARWLDERRAMLSASETMFQQLDEAEGKDAGKQWLGEETAAKSGWSIPAWPPKYGRASFSASRLATTKKRSSPTSPVPASATVAASREFWEGFRGGCFAAKAFYRNDRRSFPTALRASLRFSQILRAG
jgi:hypothetical protein